SEVLQPHLAIVMRAAEHNRNVGIDVLDQLGQRDTGDVLVEHRRETNDAVLTPVDRRKRPRQKLWSHPLLNLLQKRLGAANRAAHLLRQRLEGPKVVGMLWVVFKEEAGEQPLPQEKLLFTKKVVEREANLLGKVQIQVVTVHVEAMRLQKRG